MDKGLILSSAEGGSMGEKDGKLRHFLEDKRRYADLWNGIMFGGRQFVKAEALEYDKQMRKISNHNKALEKMRKGNGISAKELYQNDGEYLYDFRKEDKIYPVITLVLYWGTKEWDGPTTLHEMMDFGTEDLGEDSEFTRELKNLIPEMPLHFLDVSKIENTEQFKTELRPFFELYKRRNDKEAFIQYLQAEDVIKRMDEKSWQTLVGLTESKRLKKLIDTKKECEKVGKKGENIVCRALEEFYNDGINEGKTVGKDMKLIELVCRKIIKGKELLLIMEELEEDEDTIKKIYDVALKLKPNLDIEKVYSILHTK